MPPHVKVVEDLSTPGYDDIMPTFKGQVSEEEIIGAMELIWERLKVITEPSSAIALAPLLDPGARTSLFGGAARPRVGIILSGGNVDLRSLPFR